jgi:hypothetical protein
MKRIFALCAAAGALAVAAPALADTMYNPSNGQYYNTTATTTPQGYIAVPQTQPGYVAYNGFISGPVEVVTAPVRMVTAPVGMFLQPASGAIGGVTGMNVNLVPVNPHCFVQTDFNGRHTAMCGP